MMALSSAEPISAQLFAIGWGFSVEIDSFTLAAKATA